MLPSYEFPGNYVFYVAFCAAVAFFIYSLSVKVAVPARLTLNRDAWLILFLISFLMVTDVFVNSFEIATDPHGGQAWSFLAYGLAQVWNNIGMSQGTKEGFLDFWWYAHLADFLVFLNYLPYSKHSHLLTVPFNILFRRIEPTGKLQPLRHFETA